EIFASAMAVVRVPPARILSGAGSALLGLRVSTYHGARSGHRVHASQARAARGRRPAGPVRRRIGKQLRDAAIHAQVKNREECRERRRFGKTPLFIVPLASDHWEYVYDEAQSEAVSARYHVDDVLVRQRTKKTIPSPEIELVTEPGNRYIDFFMPGLMG